MSGLRDVRICGLCSYSPTLLYESAVTFNSSMLGPHGSRTIIDETVGQTEVLDSVDLPLLVVCGTLLGIGESDPHIRLSHK